MILRVLFLAVMLPFSGFGYVWTVFNYSEVSPFDGLTRNLRIGIPDDYPYVRGILVNFNASSGDTRAEYLQDYFTEFCRIHQFAFIGTEGFAQPSTNSNESALRAFTNSIASFATASGRPEINNAPFVFFSVSAGIGPANIVIRTNYSKVIAYAAGSGTFGDPPSIAATQILNVPGLLWAGDNDVSGIANKMESFVATNRPSGLLGSYAEMDLTTHAQSSLLHAAGMGFLNEMIQLSYPSGQCVVNGPITITRLAESSGWLIDSNTIRSVFETTTNYAAYAGSKPTAYWVPNKNMAYVHRAFATHLPPISLSAPVNETEVNPGANITLTVNAASFAGWTNMAIYSYSTNLANFTSGTPSFVMTNAVTGVYVFSAIGTRGGTNVVSKPVMVSVRKLTAPSYPCQGTIWYASTSGLPGNSGTIVSPWDLQTALNKTATILPGDYLYLRGGNYAHAPQGEQPGTGDQGYIFRALIAGTAALPITIQSYPGEWAKIDGGAFVHYAANARSTLKCGTGSGTAGSYLTFKNMEFYSSSTETRQSFAEDGVDTGGQTFPYDISRSEGPLAAAPGMKIINCVIHDLTTGISVFNMPGGEFYGNNVYNNGWQGTPQRHGHGMYLQTPTSAGGLLTTIKRNILAGAYKMNIQAYGSAGSQVSHQRFQENIFIGQQGQYGGMLLGTLDGGSADRLQDNEFTGNFGYGADLNLYQESDPHAYHSLKVFDNYMVHSKPKFSSWKTLVFTNNTFITPIDVNFGNVSLQTIPSALGANIPWTMDRNNYRFSPSFTSAFNWDGVANYTLAQWRSNTGYDLNSVLTTTGPSLTNHIIVQDNAYDANRAHVAAYNWTGASFLAVSVAAFGWGTNTTLLVRNAQNYFEDVVQTVTTTSNTVVVDMRAASHTVAIPYGAPVAIIPKTFPAFGAFIFEKTGVSPPPPPPTTFTTAYNSLNSADVKITLTPVDIGGFSSGNTPFARTNNSGVVTTAEAETPAISNGLVFSSWLLDGNFYSSANPITYTNDHNASITAVYTNVAFTVTFTSVSPVACPLTVFPADNTGASSDTTPFTRTWNSGTIVSATASLAEKDGNLFQKWTRNGFDYSTDLAMTFTNTATATYSAIYVPPPITPAGSSSFSARRRGIRL